MIPETRCGIKIELFQSQGRLLNEAGEGSPAQGSWFQVMHGQGLRPRGYNSIVDVVDMKDVSTFIEGMRSAIGNCIEVMPTHDEFLRRTGKAAAPAQGQACHPC